MRDFIKIPDDKFRIIKSKFGKPDEQTWFTELNRGYVNGEYAVIVRTVDTTWGKIRHAAIRNLEGSPDISWSAKQEIKDKIFGKHKIGIEIYPTEKELVDEANMYHLWILPIEMELPFSLKVRNQNIVE